MGIFLNVGIRNPLLVIEQSIPTIYKREDNKLKN